MEPLKRQSPDPLADAGKHGELEKLPFLVIGSAGVDLGPEFVARIGAPCAGIVLLEAVDPIELAIVLDAAPDPAVPIADFAGNAQIRSDYDGVRFDMDLSVELRQRFAAINHRLAAIPFRSRHEDRAELTVLRMAYSRDATIAAAFDPDSRNIVEYPLLGVAAANRQCLEGLSVLGLLRRRHFTRAHLCGHCGSARLNAFEACPSCDSADLVEEPIVHHYRCGWQAPEPDFLRDHALICPKCRRELRHHGVDYDKPGSVMVCRNCRKATSEPTLCFACLDCGAATSTAEAKAIDWYHYDLTEDGLQSLRDGRVPRFDVCDYLNGQARTFNAREFRLLVREGIRVARRYERPFAVGKLSFVNTEALRRDRGLTAADTAFRHAVDVIVEALRESDFIGTEDAHSILIGFPETAGKEAVAILDHLSERIRKAVDVPIELTVGSAEGDDVAGFLAEETPR